VHGTIFPLASYTLVMPTFFPIIPDILV